MPHNIRWTDLQRILIIHADDYKKNPGFFSGKQGLKRADNILATLATINPDTEPGQKKLILLLYAICFHSSSSTLKYSIVDAIIVTNFYAQKTELMSSRIFKKPHFHNAYNIVRADICRNAGWGQVPREMSKPELLKQLLRDCYNQFPNNSGTSLDEAAKMFKNCVEPKSESQFSGITAF